MSRAFFGAGERVAADTYCSLLQGAGFRQIDAIALGAPFAFQHDLASSHTAKQTIDLLAAEGVEMLKWLPAGADLNPLDVYVNDAVENALKGKEGLTTAALLKKEASIAIARLRTDKGFMGNAAKTCRAFPKRVAWVAANGGRKVARSLVE